MFALMNMKNTQPIKVPQSGLESPPRQSLILIFLLIFWSLVGSIQGRTQAFAQESIPRRFAEIRWDHLPICSSYNCYRIQVIGVTAAQREILRKYWQSPALSAEDERVRLKWSMAQMEKWAGEITPIHTDRARNGGVDDPGQMDCLDKATNTYSYLSLLEGEGWLKFHRASPHLNRAPFFFDQHYAAGIEDLTTQLIFAVDAWFFAFGNEPIIVLATDWKRRNPL